MVPRPSRGTVQARGEYPRVVPSSVAYRPLKYDVLVYDHALGELAIMPS